MLWTRSFKNLALIITFCVALLPTFFVVPAYAQSSGNASVEQSYDDVCGKKFNDTTDPNYQKFYKTLLDAQKYDREHPQSENAAAKTSDLLQAGCPPSINDITLIVIRLITILITIVGIIVFLNLVKASVLMMTAGANKDKIKAARGSIQGTIGGVLIIFISYSLIVFIAVRLGLAGDPEKFSILDGGSLIFKFVFKY